MADTFNYQDLINFLRESLSGFENHDGFIDSSRFSNDDVRETINDSVNEFFSSQDGHLQIETEEFLSYLEERLEPLETDSAHSDQDVFEFEFKERLTSLMDDFFEQDFDTSLDIQDIDYQSPFS